MQRLILGAVALAFIVLGAGSMYAYRSYYPLAPVAPPSELLATSEQTRAIQRYLTLSRVEQAQHAQTILNTVVVGVEQLRIDVAALKAEKDALEVKIASCAAPAAAMAARMDAIERRLPKGKRAPPPRLAPWDVRVLFTR
jgi:hypothetical protein